MKTVTLERADVRLAIRLLGELQTHLESLIESHSPANGDAHDEAVVAEAQDYHRECEDLVRRLEEALEAAREPAAF